MKPKEFEVGGRYVCRDREDVNFVEITEVYEYTIRGIMYYKRSQLSPLNMLWMTNGDFSKNPNHINDLVGIYGKAQNVNQDCQCPDINFSWRGGSHIGCQCSANPTKKLPI